VVGRIELELPIVDYSAAIERAKRWLGDHWLLAIPVQRRSVKYYG
jgi:hypothetical protein